MPESKATTKKRARKSTSSKKRLHPASAQDSSVPTEEKQHMVCEAAYYIAEQRGFSPGAELDDWLLAEAQIDTEKVRHGG